MILDRFRISTGKVQHDLIGGLWCLYGLAYGIGAFFAPKYFFSADGILPMVTENVVLDNPRVDDHYVRFSGAVLIAQILAWYLFCVGNVEHERMMIRVEIYTDIIITFVMVQTATKDVDGMFIPGIYQTMMASFIVMALYHYYLLTQLPTQKAITFPVSRADRVTLTMFAIYMAVMPAKCLIFGATRQFFPPDTEFDLLNIHHARVVGAQFTALLLVVIEGLVTNKSIPKLTYQLSCIFSIFAACILYKEVYDNENFVRKSLIAASIINAGIIFLDFNNLGAFKRDDLAGEQKPVKAKAA